MQEIVMEMKPLMYGMLLLLIVISLPLHEAASADLEWTVKKSLNLKLHL